MDRGLKAALSPNEETTLRRIGHGTAKPSELIARDIEHLSRLALIDRHGEQLILTDLGRQRLAISSTGVERRANQRTLRSPEGTTADAKKPAPE